MEWKQALTACSNRFINNMRREINQTPTTVRVCVSQLFRPLVSSDVKFRNWYYPFNSIKTAGENSVRSVTDQWKWSLFEGLSMRLSRVKYSVVCDNDACFPSLLDLFSNEKISTGGALKTLARHHFRGWGVQVPVIATTRSSWTLYHYQNSRWKVAVTGPENSIIQWQ